MIKADRCLTRGQPEPFLSDDGLWLSQGKLIFKLSNFELVVPLPETETVK